MLELSKLFQLPKPTRIDKPLYFRSKEPGDLRNMDPEPAPTCEEAIGHRGGRRHRTWIHSHDLAEITHAVRLSSAEFERFLELGAGEDYEWLGGFQGGIAAQHRDGRVMRRCLLVCSDEHRELFLVDTQGYPYPRYIAQL